MSLYTLDGDTRKLLKLERFGAADFSVKSFIEQLSGSQRHLDEDRRLDPKPYIRTFEAAKAELERLRDIAASQEEAAASAAAELNESRSLEIQDLAANVRECVREVKALDELAAEIAQATGPVGQRLERISHQHSQISNFRALISAYLSFLAEKAPSELTRLWQTDMRRCALFVAQLQSLATAIGPIEGRPDVQTQADKFAENLENQLLANFLDSYQSFDLPGMRESADILLEFNGGGSVVPAYINQHRFFMNIDHLNQDKGADDDLWLHLRTPNAAFKEFIELVDRSVGEIAETIARETEIITKVFSRPAQVLSMFVQRTFAQKIQGLITTYMEQASEQQPAAALTQVRVLSVCYRKVNSLVTDLQKTWSNPSSGLSEAEQTELGAVLESNFQDAFVLYIDDYIGLEEQSLLEIIAAEFSSVGDASAAAPSTPNAEDGRFDRLRRAMRNLRSEDPEEANSVDERSETSATAGADEHAADIGAPGSPGGASRWSKLQLTSNLQTVLSAFGEAIAREQLLRPPREFASDATVLYNLLTREIGGRYISAVVDSALAYSYKADTRSPIDWSYLEGIKISGHALRLVSAFVRTVIFAMVQSAPATQQNLADALNLYITNVQRSCRELVEQTADLMHLRTRVLLARNGRRDFLEPPNAEGVLSPSIYDELVELAESAQMALSPENSHRLLKLVALNFCDDLMNHIPQFTINEHGGAALSSDAAEYERLMTQDWALSGEVAAKFGTLRAISRLYTADQSLLSSLLRDSHLSSLTPNQLRVFLQQRADNNPKIMDILYFQSRFSYHSLY